ncbi:DUF2799 domain-containing protein [Rhizobium rhizoryzae]|uniref:DUF2799 domain-containing protein n=1 Tax=Rhizobium rhizoryzae TaxID=451876 RepID=UPI0028987DFC|nr:DUF2799 domain-containing protein [Rhizobium rhizoryzae]
MRKLLLLSALGAMCLLPSCYSFSKEECVAANWKVIGDTDGAAGYNPQSRFADHVKSCERVKVVPDQTTWYQGFQEGIKRYCTPLSGAQRGEAGDGYNNVCPPDLEPGFMRGYTLGKRVHEVRERMNSIRSSISSREQDTDQRYRELKNAKDQDRRAIQMRIDDNDFEIRRLRREADDLSYDLSNAERDLAAFRMNPQGDMRPPVRRY